MSSAVDVIASLNPRGMLASPQSGYAPFFPSFSGTGIGTTETLFQDQNGNPVAAKIPFVPVPGSSPFAASVVPPNLPSIYPASPTRILDARQPFIVRASGTASSTNGAQTIQIAMYEGTVISGGFSLFAIGPINLFNTSRSWYIEFTGIYDPVGPGRVQGQSHAFVGGTGAGWGANEVSIGALSATNVPTFSVSAKWGASDASNVVTMKSFTVDPIVP
jgi:hypothetical protein